MAITVRLSFFIILLQLSKIESSFGLRCKATNNRDTTKRPHKILIHIRMAGIYIHIPFCKSKCYYCDFYSCTLLAKKEEFLTAVGDELDRRADFLQGETIETIYIGGGTPSLCTPSEIETLLGKIFRRYPRVSLKEITVEANPDDLTFDYLRDLRATGVDRLSIGVQSFIDRDLRWMHRRHDAPSAIRAIDNAHTAGFDNLTIDLIYGIPQMSLDEWAHNLRQAFELDITHLSAYHLTLEEGTVFGRWLRSGKLHEIDSESSRSAYLLLHDMATEAGFEHYEISNFARPGFRARHNSSYWDGTHYLGVGPSAHSYDGIQRTWNRADLRQYLLLEPHNRHFDSETLSDRDLYNEFIMTSLRRIEGVDAEILEHRFGARKLHYFTQHAQKFIDEGLLMRQQNMFYIPAIHYLISDSIISDLFDVI